MQCTPAQRLGQLVQRGASLMRMYLEGDGKAHFAGHFGCKQVQKQKDAYQALSALVQIHLGVCLVSPRACQPLTGQSTRLGAVSLC